MFKPLKHLGLAALPIKSKGNLMEPVMFTQALIVIRSLAFFDCRLAFQMHMQVF